MSTVELKNKIHKSLEKLDAAHLQSAYLILKEIVNQQKFTKANPYKNIVDTKIGKGLQQLKNGEGTDFGIFLNEMKVSYGKKK